jgi:altronate dehydratase small subunit
MRAIVMKPVDNVCTVVEAIEPGTSVTVAVGAEQLAVTVVDKIPFGHKFALRAIKRGEAVKKYGETIGLATRDILPGQHVHVHNLESCRGRGDK